VKTAVDIFSGAGGMSIGATMAEYFLAIEYDTCGQYLSNKSSKDQSYPMTSISYSVKRNRKISIILFGGLHAKGFSCKYKNTQFRQSE
jgi:hypothetical protein